MMEIDALIKKHEKLIMAAVVAFSRSTYDGVSTTDVAREAGVSQPYIMQVFHSKPHLYSVTQKYVYDKLLQGALDSAREGNITRGERSEVSSRIADSYLNFTQRSLQSAHHDFIAERIRELYANVIEKLVVQMQLPPETVATKIMSYMVNHFIHMLDPEQLLLAHKNSPEVLRVMQNFELHSPRKTASTPESE